MAHKNVNPDQVYCWEIKYLRGDREFVYNVHPDMAHDCDVGLRYTYSERTASIEATTKEEALAVLQEGCGSTVLVAPVLVVNRGVPIP
jgi:hypothetical protein